MSPRVVSISPAPVFPVLQLQLPRVRPSEDEGLLPGAPERVGGPEDPGADSGGPAKPAVDEGQSLFFCVLLEALCGVSAPPDTALGMLLKIRDESNGLLTSPLEANYNQPVLPAGQTGGGGPEDGKLAVTCAMSN